MAVKPAMVATVGGVAIVGGLAYWLTQTDEGRSVLERLQQSAKSVGTAQAPAGFADLLGAMPRDFQISIPEIKVPSFDVPDIGGQIQDAIESVTSKGKGLIERGENYVAEKGREFGDVVTKPAINFLSKFGKIYDVVEPKYLFGLGIPLLETQQKAGGLIKRGLEKVGQSPALKYVAAGAIGGVPAVVSATGADVAVKSIQKVASSKTIRQVQEQATRRRAAGVKLAQEAKRRRAGIRLKR